MPDQDEINKKLSENIKAIEENCENLLKEIAVQDCHNKHINSEFSDDLKDIQTNHNALDKIFFRYRASIVAFFFAVTTIVLVIWGETIPEAVNSAFTTDLQEKIKERIKTKVEDDVSEATEKVHERLSLLEIEHKENLEAEISLFRRELAKQREIDQRKTEQLQKDLKTANKAFLKMLHDKPRFVAMTVASRGRYQEKLEVWAKKIAEEEVRYNKDFAIYQRDVEARLLQKSTVLRGKRGLNFRLSQVTKDEKLFFEVSQKSEVRMRRDVSLGSDPMIMDNLTNGNTRKANYSFGNHNLYLKQDSVDSCQVTIWLGYKPKLPIKQVIPKPEIDE